MDYLLYWGAFAHRARGLSASRARDADGFNLVG